MLIPLKAFQNSGNCRLKIYKSKTNNLPFVIYGAERWPTPQPSLKEDTFSAQLVAGAASVENYKLYIDGQLSQEVSPTIIDDKIVFNFANLAINSRKQIQLQVSDNNVQKRDSKLSTPLSWPSNNLKDNSWSTIKKALVSGTQLWDVGDSKPITLTNNSKFDIILLDTKPSRYTTTDTSKSSNMAVLGFTSSVAKMKMRDTATNEGGWSSSLVNSWLNNEFIQLLPDDLKQCLSSVKVMSGAGNHTTDLVTSDCRLFLPAGVEVYQVATAWLSGESELETNAKFNYFDTKTYLADAWLRSPHYVIIDGAGKSRTNFIVANRPVDSEKANTEHEVFPIFVFADVDEPFEEPVEDGDALIISQVYNIIEDDDNLIIE